jgi:hypothetical protein
VVPGVNVSSDVPARREKAFEEANIISGRPDVSRGEAPGSITAAAAIMALQQAGQKAVIHKAKQWKQGWAKVLELIYDEMLDNWDEPMWMRINKEQPDYKFIDPSTLRNVPVMAPNLNPNDGEEGIKPLMDTQPVMNGEEPMMDEYGQPAMQTVPVTREAEFDLTLNIGDGFPSDKVFQYQTMIENAKLILEGRPVISWQEYRTFLKENLGMKLGEDTAIPPPMPPGMPGAPPIGAPTGPVGVPMGGGLPSAG